MNAFTLYTLPPRCSTYYKGIAIVFSPFYPFFWISKLSGTVFSVPFTMKICIAIPIGKRLEVED